VHVLSTPCTQQAITHYVSLHARSFLLSDEGQALVASVGYVPLPPSLLKPSQVQGHTMEHVGRRPHSVTGIALELRTPHSESGTASCLIAYSVDGVLSMASPGIVGASSSSTLSFVLHSLLHCRTL
jgi:hypothetical protein